MIADVSKNLQGYQITMIMTGDKIFIAKRLTSQSNAKCFHT